jgi:predicted esterase
MFSTIIPIGGIYMDSLLDAYLKDSKSLMVEIFHGTKDDVNSFSAMQEAHKKLRASGLNVSMTTYPLGHTYNGAILEEVLKRVK